MEVLTEIRTMQLETRGKKSLLQGYKEVRRVSVNILPLYKK